MATALVKQLRMYVDVHACTCTTYTSHGTSNVIFQQIINTECQCGIYTTQVLLNFVEMSGVSLSLSGDTDLQDVTQTPLQMEHTLTVLARMLLK